MVLVEADKLAVIHCPPPRAQARRYREIAYGLKIARAVDGKHLVINTNSNGWGPPGFESGECLGEGTSYGFRLPEAISLVANANPPL